MSWAHGVTASGREIGYGVPETCNCEGCDVAIDRGLAYVCGGMHEGGRHGCGDYFCSAHLAQEINDADEVSPQLCATCLDRWASA